MAKRHAEALWREYEKAIFGTEKIDPIQRSETRQAFYAGMLAIFDCLCSDPCFAEGTDESREASMADLDKELRATIRKMVEARRAELN